MPLIAFLRENIQRFVVTVTIRRFPKPVSVTTLEPRMRKGSRRQEGAKVELVR
jgi:hypothetical protein